MEALDLRAITAQVVEACRPGIEGHRHTLQLDVGSTPVWVYADAARVTRVISNLLDNAARYMPDGGVISIVVSTDDGCAAVKVVDNGIGIAPDKISEIFEPFKQASDSTQASSGGLGLGLALVKRLTELQGGTVAVTSVDHGGSCLYGATAAVCAAWNFSLNDLDAKATTGLCGL